MDKKTFDDYLNDPNIQNIIRSVNNKYSYVDSDDQSSISMETLWRCTNRYDNTKGAKFTSFLYQQLTFAYKNLLKKKKSPTPMGSLNEIAGIQTVDTSTVNVKKNKHKRSMYERKLAKEEAQNILYPMLESIPNDSKNIIQQRFFSNMTMKEIAMQNGYSRETARRKLKKAIDICKKLEKNI